MASSPSKVVRAFLRRLQDSTGTSSPIRQFKQWVKAGRIDYLREAALALVAPGSYPEIEESHRDHILEQIGMVLALTSDPACAETLVEVHGAGEAARLLSGISPRMNPRYLAALLASGQRLDTLVTLFERYAEDTAVLELMACLLQESVLRGMPVAEVPAISGFAGRLHGVGHPLANLPLHLLPIEENLHHYLPSYSYQGKSCSIPFGPRRSRPVESAGSSQAADYLPHEITTLEEAARMEAAVANWREESNGTIEARIFAVSPLLQPERVSAPLLQTLRLECLEGAGQPQIALWESNPSEALELLFAAAANGGAYNQGLLPAYGRLEGWRSLGAMAGAPANEDIGTILGLANQCRWWYFEASSSWFQQVAWDLGLLTLRPDVRSIAVLAGTDSD